MIRKVLITASLLLWIGCANSSPKITKQECKKERIEMKIQDYETYVVQKSFMLPRCQEHIGERKTVYLEDNTKIAYSCAIGENGVIRESISYFKYPFRSVEKSYFHKNKKLRSSVIFVAGARVGEEVKYDKFGKRTLYRDNTKIYGVGWKHVLAWADKKGFIDLKNAKVLYGSSMTMTSYPMMSYESYLRLNPNEEQKKAYKNSGKEFWSIEFSLDDEIKYFIFSKNGVLVAEGSYGQPELLDHAIMNKR